MPISSAVPPTAAAVEDRSPTASDSEEYEYEEIEIEEEVEVEEEVSDDEEEEFEEVEEEVEVEDDDDEEEYEQEHEKRSGEDVSLLIEDRDDEKRTEKIISDNEKAPQCDGGITTAEIVNPINESSKEMNGGDSVNESDKLPHSEEQMNTPKDVNDTQQKEPRLDVDVPSIRPRSLSPATATEVNQGNKRPALICDFFAKGWCIKGTSCRFRHIKDPTNIVDQQNVTQKSQPHDDEGVRESTARSDMATSAAVTPSLIACSSEIKPTESQKDNHNPVINPHVNADSLLPETKSNPFMGSSNIHKSNWASSYATKMEEFGGKGYHFGLHNHNYNSSYHSTVWPRTSSFLSSSSWKSDSKFSSYDWEPSKPFRSAFLISQGISTPDIQYDPIRDSIDTPPTKIGDKLSKLSSSATHSPLKEKLKVDYHGSDRISVGSHVNGNENDNDNDMDVDSNEIGDTKQENTKSESKGKKHIGDVIQAASEIHVSSHNSLGGPTKEVNNNNHKLDFDAEGDMHRESKSLRHFRAALIEFVKDIVKPTWRDGKLSKDAHKLIVKKAVDKVLSTLPPEHIPTIRESIDIYLTSSQRKLKKLVEGYIGKYGKL